MLTHRDMLRGAANAYGARPALIDEAGDALSYRDLERQTSALADGLLGSGLRPGDRVVWLGRNCVEYLIAYFATAKAGLVFSPLNFWLRPAEMEALLEVVRPQGLIADADHAEIMEAVALPRPPVCRVVLGSRRSGWSTWEELLTVPGNSAAVANDEHAVHEIIFTSGTTGQAKGVLRSQRKRILDSLTSALAFEVTRNEHLLFFGPQFHVGGAAVPNQVLVQGGVASVFPFDVERVAQAIGDGATYIIGVPAHYNLLFEAGALDGVDTSRVRGCYVGGSIATPTLFQAIGAHFPRADFVHGYGSTESGPHTLALRGEEFLAHPGALGLPVPGTETRVVDGDGGEAAPGEVGELLVRSGTVMDGYLDRPELTAEVLDAEGWLRTGDLVSRDEEGYFRLAGRAKEMIISGGENVYPKEIEDVLSAHEAVAEVAVVGVTDPIYEERVVAVVRVVPHATVSGDELCALVRGRLAGFKTPKAVHFVEDFPRTPLGKIAKHELVTRYEGGTDG